MQKIVFFILFTLCPPLFAGSSKTIPVHFHITNNSNQYLWIGKIESIYVQQDPPSNNDEGDPSSPNIPSFKRQEEKTTVITLPPGKQYIYKQEYSYSKWWIFTNTTQPESFYITDLASKAHSKLTPQISFNKKTHDYSYSYKITEDQWLSLASHHYDVTPSKITHHIVIS